MPRGARSSAAGQDVLHPTVKALAAALGKSRQTVHEWQVMTPPAPAGPPFSEVAYRLFARQNGFSLASPRTEVAILLGDRAEASPTSDGTTSAPSSLPSARAADVHDEAARRLSRVRELQATELEISIAEKQGELMRTEDVVDLVEAIAAIAAAVVIDVPELVAGAVAKATPSADQGAVRELVQQLCDDARRRIVSDMLSELRRRLRPRTGATSPGSPGGTGGGDQTTPPSPDAGR